jgi:integrase
LAKIQVNVESFEGRLRLRWRHNGRRYCLALGLGDRPVNRLVAEQKSRAIEADIVTGNFDPTLVKYRPAPSQSEGISLVELFDRFQAFKAKTDIDRKTLDKYKGLKPKLGEYFQQRSAALVGREDAEAFRAWLLCEKKLAPVTVKERIGLVKAAYDWGKQKKLVLENPFAQVRVKVPTLPPPDVFTAEEQQRILEAFRTHRTYHYFADYVEFAMKSGCRPAELIGLRWRSVSDDCSQIVIWESLSRGVRKQTKTNRTRTIALNRRLQTILKERRPDKPDPDGLVFASTRGGALDDHNFRNRAWKPILEELGLDYRKPYTTRHTAHSHLLDQGWSPAEVAETMGNSVRVVYSRYAANVKGRRKLPD